LSDSGCSAARYPRRIVHEKIPGGGGRSRHRVACCRRLPA